MHETVSPQFIIEKYHDSFKDQVTDLVATIQQKEFGLAITIAEQPSLTNISEIFFKGSGTFLVARAGQRIVGTIGLEDVGHGLGELRKMFVAPEYRGKEKGVAQQLYNALETHARTSGFNKIILGTSERYARAHRFYEKNGFTPLAKELLPPEIKPDSVDTMFFEKQLHA